MNQFLHWFGMGGYGLYVWPAYGLLGGILLMNWVNIKWQRKRTRKVLQQWYKKQ
ncbi:heme exporter protein CcmD [Legionella septentrionalis]|uniref:Heme exporter protein D n=1 Tax=Legionella septentrionalis TaxID=2498109 RepID=A0A3S0V9T6_9GAMM|nr:heme exporter protein CcmD [Legionella septentrionalis]RUQ81615.1 heme exporter protein CcmD [Legionella septentrionalis]RUQ95739.1 heme exporter protein CcmD [Legionella septentrionalis]RUR09147.1 heme exporter protein CcmD [Legionella septentrionalis]RUR15654.1 heme exporter protein CcmD [Legionella septentrionalis]